MSDGEIAAAADGNRSVFFLHWIVLIRPMMMMLFAAGGMAVVWTVGAMMVGPSGAPGLLLPAALGTLGLLVIVAGPVLQAVVRRETTTVEVFDDHIVMTTGLFQKYERSVRASEVVGVDLYQGMSQRMLGCGDLRIETRGVDSLVISDLEEAEAAKRLCQQRIASAKGYGAGGQAR